MFCSVLLVWLGWFCMLTNDIMALKDLQIAEELLEPGNLCLGVNSAH